jgi:hypothetical protein
MNRMIAFESTSISTFFRADLVVFLAAPLAAMLWFGHRRARYSPSPRRQCINAPTNMPRDGTEILHAEWWMSFGVLRPNLAFSGRETWITTDDAGKGV